MSVVVVMMNFKRILILYIFPKDIELLLAGYFEPMRSAFD